MTDPRIGRDQLATWWRVIQEKAPELVLDGRAPLAHTAQAAAYFNLPELPVRSPAQALQVSLDGLQPSFKALAPEILLGLRARLYRADGLEIVRSWAEKLMRYCEIYLPRLEQRALKKCGGSLDARLLVLQLAAFLLDASLVFRDLRFLNTVLKLLDQRWLANPGLVLDELTRRTAGGYAAIALAAAFQVRLFLVSEYALAQAAKSSISVSGSGLAGIEETAEADARNYPMCEGSKVVIFSPSQYSLYTISVAEMLLRQNVQVAAIFTRRLLSSQRFFSEYSRDGKRIFQKIWKKLVLRRRAYVPQEYETLASLMQRAGIDFKSTGQLQKRYGIPVVFCKDLNDPLVAQELERIQPDLVVFTGGGLVRKEVLLRSGQGVLNCHMGILPGYRGRDVVEWPLLEGQFRQVGLTVHFMDEGVDTGDILRLKPTLPRPGESRAQLRERLEGMMVGLMVGACLDALSGQIERQPQTPGAGRQYFFMHPRLIVLAEAALK
jgi:folate-dependent phosphoribosylglycinamide formyltransferase PurN